MDITSGEGGTVASSRTIPKAAGYLIALAAVAALFGAAFAATALAQGSAVTRFSVTPSTTQAGGHPDIRTIIETENVLTVPVKSACECEDPKDLKTHIPSGVIGVPQLIPRCTDLDFGKTNCPPDSQVGVLEVGLNLEDFNTPRPSFLKKMAVYNLVPHPGQAGLLGANISFFNTPFYFVFSPRTGGDYGLDIDSISINHTEGLHWVDLTIWGVPADPSHQEDRFPHGCRYFTEEGCHPGVPSTAPLMPFTVNPTTCDEPLAATIDVFAYDHGVTHGSALYPATTGCDQLAFNPSLFAQPTTTASDSASGVDIDLRVPQDLSPTAPSASEIRSSIVTLPEGFTVNANAADGKESCSDAQAAFGTEEAAQCPEFSKIGTLNVTSPTLPGPLPGYLYLGEPKSGERYRLVLVADGYNVHVKLPGTLTLDPTTGQVTVTFRELPQFPLSDINLHVFGAERGSLATPTACGTYPVRSTFVPWDSLLPDQTSVQYFTVSTGSGGTSCPGKVRPFAPTAEAGVTDKTGGSSAPFVLRASRQDGDQDLSGLNITTPAGFTASLKGVPYCSEAAIQRLQNPSYSGLLERVSPSCPAASRVGTVYASAGAGSRPVTVTGAVYLAGPYKGAPLSIEAVIPAVSGPYDLGNVAVRTAVSVDPVTAQVRAVSDPFPQIIGGIPLRARSIQLSLDRPGFALNPTNCSSASTKVQLFGDQGGTVIRTPHFQAANCANLPYAPALQLRLSGGVQRRGHPAIHAVMKTNTGDANTHRLTVALPAGELLDNSHIDTICTRVQFANDSCPDGSRIGHVEVRTPLLDNPLTGSVYLRASSHALPDIVLDLNGQIHIEAAARISTVKGQLRTTFENVPDVPIGTVTLDLLGGSKGLLQNSTGLCGVRKRATIAMVGQNGKTLERDVPLNPLCGQKKKKKKAADGVKRPSATGKAVGR
jgi:hypothetical protein